MSDTLYETVIVTRIVKNNDFLDGSGTSVHYLGLVDIRCGSVEEFQKSINESFPDFNIHIEGDGWKTPAEVQAYIWNVHSREDAPHWQNPYEIPFLSHGEILDIIWSQWAFYN